MFHDVIALDVRADARRKLSTIFFSVHIINLLSGGFRFYHHDSTEIMSTFKIENSTLVSFSRLYLNNDKESTNEQNIILSSYPRVFLNLN